jgi:hypothetical protein
VGMKLGAKLTRAVEAAAVPGTARRVDAAALAPGGTLAEWVILPPPPSTNNLYLNARKGRVKTAEYRRWIEAADPVARTLAPPASLPCRLNYLLAGKWREQSDGFNREKALTDLLVACGVVPGDSLRHLRGGQWDVLPLDRPACVVVWFEAWAPVADAARAWAELECP